MNQTLAGVVTITVSFWAIVLSGAASALACEDARGTEQGERAAANGEGDLRPFLGEPKMEMQQLFDDERFPNVVVARDGAVLATWGSKRVRVRRSEDGGKIWGSEILVGDGIHGGGAIVDEQRGDVLLFVHPEHPPGDGMTAPRTVYRSTDQGRTWQATEAMFGEDARGFTPALHMSEHGATLVHGEHSGRLIRPARVYQTSPSRYATAIYSDDGGRNWRAGGPLPIRGTGEGAHVELSDGRLIYSARKSFFAEGEPLRQERLFAFSDDGGQTWRDPKFSPVIPDGPRYRGEERRGANYNGHFGMLAGFVRLPVEGRDILVYSNADHDGHERIRLTVWASFDGGRTWPVKRLVHEGPSAYSSLAAGRPGTPGEGWIYLQFEYGQEGQQYVGCKMARFNLAWLMAGEATGDGRLPEWLSAAERPARLRPQAAGVRKPASTSLPPNVLLITSEDNGPELSCYGDRFVQTPHLDRLAADGLRFDRAFVPTASCSESRSALLTGLYPHQNGQIGLATHHYRQFEGVPNIVQRLKARGYRTGLIGKLHVNPASAFPFDERPDVSNCNTFSRRDVRRVAELAAEFMSAGDEPFFLMVNYADAHLPFLRRQEGLPEKPLEAADVRPLPWIGLDTPRLRQQQADYYNCLLRLDEGVAMLMDSLDRSGQAVRTLVIYLGDHGAQFPRGKLSSYESGLRVPLLIQFPRSLADGRIAAGGVRNELVTTLDLAPTILEAAGAETPPNLPGRSLLSLFGDDAGSWRRYLATEYHGHYPPLYFPQRTVRDERYKLIVNLLQDRPNPVAETCSRMDQPRHPPYVSAADLAAAEEPVRQAYETWYEAPPLELYDLQFDPYEWRNRADDPALAEVKARLLAELRRWQAETADPLADPVKLAKLTAEHDGIEKPYVRRANFQWRYPEYLAPDDAASAGAQDR